MENTQKGQSLILCLKNFDKIYLNCKEICFFENFLYLCWILRENDFRIAKKIEDVSKICAIAINKMVSFFISNKLIKT